MNRYTKFLYSAVLIGVLTFWSGVSNTKEIVLSQVILSPSFYYVEYYPVYLPVVTRWYSPLILFHIVYGTYIYQHFCTASVYYFSRNTNRKRWYFGELIELYGYGLSYISLFLVTGIIVCFFENKVIVDDGVIYVLVYYLLIQSLFLFVTTLMINILSIRLSGMTAFAIVEGICLLSIILFLFTGNLAQDENVILESYAWLIKINPFAQMVFSVHSSLFDKLDVLINLKGLSFDLNISILYYFVLAVIVIGYGYRIVSHYEFLNNNKELV